MKRLSSRDFINEIKKAPEWMLAQADDGCLRLIVREKDEMKEFLGPDPLEMETDIEYRAFLNEVRKITEIPAIRRSQMG